MHLLLLHYHHFLVAGSLGHDTHCVGTGILPHDTGTPEIISDIIKVLRALPLGVLKERHPLVSLVSQTSATGETEARG